MRILKKTVSLVKWMPGGSFDFAQDFGWNSERAQREKNPLCDCIRKQRVGCVEWGMEYSFWFDFSATTQHNIFLVKSYGIRKIQLLGFVVPDLLIVLEKNEIPYLRTLITLQTQPTFCDRSRSEARCFAPLNMTNLFRIAILRSAATMYPGQ